MTRFAILVVSIGLVACKGSTATTEASAPSASAPSPPPASPSASATAITATATATASATATAPASALPAARCSSCERIHVNDIYPHQNGHAMPHHDRDVKIISVDPSTCTTTVKDVATGANRTERCDSTFFDEPRTNPAG